MDSNGRAVSQVETTALIRELADRFGTAERPHDLVRLRAFIFEHLVVRPYDRRAEAKIRWRRTASQVMEDGYVYATKYCTDIVLVFCALCRALDRETRFLKLTRAGGGTHSIAEVRLPEGWFWFDVAIPSEPVRGEVHDGWEYHGWSVAGKGRDAWELGYGRPLEDTLET